MRRFGDEQGLVSMGHRCPPEPYLILTCDIAFSTTSVIFGFAIPTHSSPSAPGNGRKRYRLFRLFKTTTRRTAASLSILGSRRRAASFPMSRPSQFIVNTRNYRQRCGLMPTGKNSDSPLQSRQKTRTAQLKETSIGSDRSQSQRTSRPFLRAKSALPPALLWKLRTDPFRFGI